MWIDKVFPGSALDNIYRFHNYNLTITAPDGTVSSFVFPNITDTTSNYAYTFTPTQEGTYNLTFIFPGQAVNAFAHSTDMSVSPFGEGNGWYQNDTYAASNATTTLNVQHDPIGNIIDTYPLPTEYWTRPIYGENSIWYTISSNWLGNGAPGYGGFASTYNMGGNGMLFSTDAIGPLTSHIMWTRPTQTGGVVGGNNFQNYPGDTYFEGSAYAQRYTNPIVVNGKIYYTEAFSFAGSPGNFYGNPVGPTKCIDLRTGQLIWSRTDVPALSFAYIYTVQDPNQHGVFPAILCTANFAKCYDADTGDFLFNVTNVPSGPSTMGPQGEHLRFVLQNKGTTSAPSWYLAEWNSSRLWDFSGLLPSASGTIDASTANRFDWNVSVSGLSSMRTSPTAIAGFANDMVIYENGTLPSSGGVFMGSYSTAPYSYFAINLNASKTAIGNLRWGFKTYNAPTGNLTVLEAGVDKVNRVFVENIRETMQFVGYSMDTGLKVWGPTPSQAALDYYGSPASGSLANNFAYGHLYSAAYAGIVYCYDTKTGELLWTYGNGGVDGNNTNSGYGVPGPYPTFINAVGNGVIYTVTTEHTIETPLFKGAMCRAINATDGTEIWTLNSYVGEFATTSYAIADGYATWFNGLDNQIYSVGKGPSQTTIAAPNVAAAFNAPVVITGSVTDISAGTNQNEQAARFPNGVACASDMSMKDWMGYVYQQKPLPTNFTGVDVTLTVVDPNNNVHPIGTVKTDASGSYNYVYTPEVPGKYTVIANFAGSNGYWPSYSESAFAVMEAQPTASPVPTQAPSQADLYFVPAIAGLFVFVAIIGVLIIMVLIKRA